MMDKHTARIDIIDGGLQVTLPDVELGTEITIHNIGSHPITVRANPTEVVAEAQRASFALELALKK